MSTFEEPTHHIDVDVQGATAVVCLDGTDITNNLAGYSIRQRIGQQPQVELDLPLVMATADTAAVTVPVETRDVLLRLGWTPPHKG